VQANQHFRSTGMPCLRNHRIRATLAKSPASCACVKGVATNLLLRLEGHRSTEATLATVKSHVTAGSHCHGTTGMPRAERLQCKCSGQL
jgi:hypothetical protein